MKKNLVVLIISTCISVTYSQSLIKGTVVDSYTLNPLSNVSIHHKNASITTKTNAFGVFELYVNTLGTILLEFSLTDYITQQFKVTNTTATLDLGIIVLERASLEDDIAIITLTDDELSGDTSYADIITGLLQASKDIFLRTAAFDFNNSFFRVRGLDSDFSSVLLNGIEMNKLINGRPLWSSWGGLNDVTRNQEFTRNAKPSPYTFGHFLGVTAIDTRAAMYTPIAKTTYTFSNRSYQHRFMATYASGLLKNKWSYVFSASKRWATEGFSEGTSYNAYGFFVGIEKQINQNHSLNFSGILSPNRRGKSSPNTHEVYQLKDPKYNAYWGYQNGVKRNARLKEVVEPMLFLNHYWTVNEKLKIHSHFGYQFGKIGNSRLDFGGSDIDTTSGFPEGGGHNPDPTYYQKLPSYALRNFPNQTNIAYGLQQEFLTNGQIQWNELYAANLNAKNMGKNGIYILYEDRVDDKLTAFSSQVFSELNSSTHLEANLSYKHVHSDNYARVLDDLGGTGYLDVNAFSSDFNIHPEIHQNNTLTPNRIVVKGDRFKYNYTIDSHQFSAFVQLQKSKKNLDFFIASQLNHKSYRREGHYKNGRYPSNSFGRGAPLNFMAYGLKSGISYKLSSKHIVECIGVYQTQTPTLENAYINPREHHLSVPEISVSKQFQLEGSYNFRSPKLTGRITGYIITRQNEHDVSYYFADGIYGENADFIQETLVGIDKKHLGMEFGMEWKPMSNVTLKSVVAIGEFVYANNPKLYVSSDALGGPVSLGKSYLKNYRLPSGPQKAFSVGIEYRDANYWWFGITANRLSNTYLSVNALQRTSNFYTDYDGLVFSEYDADVANSLLKQERLAPHLITNLVGGKSWKLKRYYLNVFLSVSNLLNSPYKTGGFEQARNANYRTLLEDKLLQTPVFGPKYWYGYGTTYFLNISLSLRNP